MQEKKSVKLIPSTAGIFFHHFLLNSSRFKLKLLPKLKHFFGKLKVSEIFKLEFQNLY